MIPMSRTTPTTLRLDPELRHALDALVREYAARGLRVSRSGLLQRAASFGLPYIAHELTHGVGA